ncbi:MAG: winged helix-turn-helix transcriptional regulator [Chloroflexota bacterium]
MALQKRLVVYGRALRDGPELDVLLRTRGFQVYSVEAEEDLLDSVRHSQPDAAILGAPAELSALVRLVGECQRVGRSFLVVVRPQAPVNDAVNLLDAGADYVVTSFHPDLLAAQLRAALRRFGMDRSAPSIIELGYLCVDLQRRQVTVNEREVGLTRTEFDVLRVLAERPGTVLPSGEIMQHVMGIRIPESEAQDLLKVHIHRLRQKLEQDSDNPRFIRTVRGKGYMYAFERRTRNREATAPPSNRRTDE